MVKIRKVLFLTLTILISSVLLQMVDPELEVTKHIPDEIFRDETGKAREYKEILNIPRELKGEEAIFNKLEEKIESSRKNVEFSELEKDLLEKSSEKFNFNADVTRLMDIIINSLYTHKEVFIRELISNASDACDKVRFLSIQHPSYLGDTKDLEIRVEYDKDAKTFTITDTGVGMSKNDLIKNLGTIAKSGTTSFIEAISKGNTLNLIGQFGVGFYSTYLVSNKVVVTSKNNDDDQHVWVSTAGSYFTISRDPRGNTLGRGSRVTLHLKPDSYEFVDQDVIRKNIKKYSEFINFPIYLRVNKTFTREEEIEDEEENKEEKKEETTGDDLEVTDEKKEEKKAKKTRTVNDWKWEWELLNENKPIWLRDRKEISKEEYNKFYKALTKDSEEPLAYDHNKIEGEVNYKYIMYIPNRRLEDGGDGFSSQKKSAIKLYVRRVLVNEEFEELIPRYMNFIKGVVDSDDLPLNVSREQLQQHKMIKVMNKKLARTAIQMIMKLALEKEEDSDDSEDDTEDDNEEENAEEEEDDEETKTSGRFLKFWENFGKNIKLGVIEDSTNRSKLAKLLRFYSTKSIDKLISLEDYVGRMKDGQEFIYFLAGEDKNILNKSPLIQKLREKDVEVLLLDDPIDEFCFSNLGEFEKKKLKNAAKGDIKALEDTEDEKKLNKKIKKNYKPLIDWWKKQLGSKIESIVISKRLTDTPCIITTSEYGYTANMERIQKAQAFSNLDKGSSSYMYGKKTLEINPNHPVIKELLYRIKNEETVSSDVEDTARLLYDSAALTSGINIFNCFRFHIRRTN